MSEALDVLIGNDVKFSVVFTDEDGDTFDPETVTFTIHPDEGADVVYTYGEDADIVRDSEGRYHIWIQRDDDGGYAGFFAGTGVIRARGCAKVNMIAECP